MCLWSNMINRHVGDDEFGRLTVFTQPISTGFDSFAKPVRDISHAV